MFEDEPVEQMIVGSISEGILTVEILDHAGRFLHNKYFRWSDVQQTWLEIDYPLVVVSS